MHGTVNTLWLFVGSRIQSGLRARFGAKSTFGVFALEARYGCGFVVKCFSCANFGIVDDPHDIWRLLSFEKRLNEAMLAHQNVKHFLNNYGEVKAKLNKLKEQFKKAHLKAAERLLERECHPLWDEESVMDIFRG